MITRYLERFQTLANEQPKNYTVHGTRVLIELLPKKELVSKGGIVLQSVSTHLSTLAENQHVLGIVLAGGEGYKLENGTVIAPSVAPGNVVEVSKLGLRYRSSHPLLAECVPETLAYIDESDILSSFETIEDYERAYQLVNHD